MAPILGIYASQISGHLFAPSGAYDSIATVTPYTTTTSVVFSSIPSGYTHLQIRAITKNGTSAGSETSILAQFNGDTTYTNYYGRHLLYGDGNSAAAAASTGASWTGSAVGAIAQQRTANAFSACVIDILDYSNSSKYKTSRTLSGADYNGSGGVYYMSSLWMNTNAITSITLKPFADTFGANSHFALYGIKGGN
jgi:hypothetical protein